MQKIVSFYSFKLAFLFIITIFKSNICALIVELSTIGKNKLIFV